jgi:hypothetical protein
MDEAVAHGRQTTDGLDSRVVRRDRIRTQSHNTTAELNEKAQHIIQLEILFDKLLKLFMGQLSQFERSQSTSHLANLLMRLDYNNFFSAGVDA